MADDAGSLSDEELAAMQARADAATPAPWMARFGGQRQNVFVSNKEVILFDVGHLAPSTPDMEFIAAARSDVPRLLAEVRRLRAALAAKG